MREFVARTVGAEHLIPLIGVYDDVDEIDPATLPEAFVLKGTHGSGMNVIVADKASVDWDGVRATARRWLATDYSRLYREAPYRAVPRRLVVEELLSGVAGAVPVDYKFFVFSGKARLFEIDYSRFSRHMQAFFLPDGRRLAVDRGRAVPEVIPPLPSQLEEMVALAEKLGAGHEYVRVDLYDVGGRTYFGELTFYPSGALNLWRPRSSSTRWGPSGGRVEPSARSGWRAALRDPSAAGGRVGAAVAYGPHVLVQRPTGAQAAGPSSTGSGQPTGASSGRDAATNPGFDNASPTYLSARPPLASVIAPPAASNTAWAAAVSHHIVGPSRA